MASGSDPGREFLRHTVATLAYRGGKALRGAPLQFAAFRAGGRARTPGEILAHLGDLLDWALALARGESVWKDSPALSWEEGSARFFEALGRFDAFLASGVPLGRSAEKLFQGPIADALAHVGQIAILRRLSGSPIKGENYFKADIVSGRVGEDQAAPTLEFD
jgi:hypothetical protein